MSLSPSRVLTLSALALAFSTAALAAPKVGDSATLAGNLVGNGINLKVTTFQKITAYDQNTDVFTVEQTQTIGAQAQTKDVQVKGSDMLTEETAALIVQGCASQKIGTKEHITVAAGAFDTCRVAGQNGSTLWIAPIPFGVVKLQTAISVGTISLGMSQFTHGR